jgi:hypothetical protein
MSDFPELEDFSNVAASNDPQADFLARERALLGDEFGAPPESYQETIQAKQDDDDQFGLGDFSSAPIDHHPQPAARPPVSASGAPDELTSFQDQYPDISHDIPDQTVSHTSFFAFLGVSRLSTAASSCYLLASDVVIKSA